MNNIRKLKEVLYKLGFVLNHKQKIASIKVIIVVFISSMLELLGVSAVMPFVQSITNPSAVEENQILKFASERIIHFESDNSVIYMGIMLIVIYIVKNIFMIIAYYIQYDYSSRVSMELSSRMFSAYMKQPYEFFVETNTASILRGCISDASGVYVIIGNLIQIVTEVMSMGLIAIFIIYTDYKMAITIMSIMIIVTVSMLFVFKPIFKNIGKEQINIATEKNKIIVQMTSGIKEILVLQRKAMMQEKYVEVLNDERILNRKRETLSSSPDRITEGICVSGIVGIVTLRLALQDSNMIEFIPQLAAFAMAAFKIFPSVGKVTSRLNNVVAQIPALDNVYENYKDTAYNEVEIEDSDKDVLSFNDSICVRHINWKYRNQEKNVLEDVNIEIKKGQSIGVIGTSGGGKTTFADILLGLLIPGQGEVLVDGHSIYDNKYQWSSMIGFVPQNIFLLDDTIRENVLFGARGSDEYVWQALEQAQLRDYVMGLPEQLDTVVGECGVKLSGGQRQRIAIARALFVKPQVLVLDEATAALDNDTEKAVMDAIENLQGKITLVIIAHRLSTIKKCDVIFEVSNGKVLEKEV